MIIAISGLHGTGKSTIAKKIAEKLGIRHYSTGDAFRELAEEMNMTLEEFTAYVEKNPEIDKKLDLVINKKKISSYYRTLHPSKLIKLMRIGKNIDKDDADYEFIGIAYFSKNGASILKKVYEDSKKRVKGRFHEAETFDQSSVLDIFQEIIDRGFTVNALEVYKGWIEIHNKKDIEIAKRMLNAK